MFGATGEDRRDRMIVFGDLMVDVVARVGGPLARGSDTPAGIAVLGGGSGANVAAWTASLGAPVVFVCRIGDDERGRIAVDDLYGAGVEVHTTVDPELPTGTCIVLVEPNGERTMVPDAGANDAPFELPEDLLSAGDHLHLTGYTLLRAGPRPAGLDAIARAHREGMTVSVDPSSWALLAPGAIPPVDLLIPNEDEVATLAGEADAERAARALAGRSAPEIVVKLGAEGALWTDGSEVVRVPAEPAEVVDTTGAGDAFAAGLLTARLAGAGPREALEAGCRAGAQAVTRVGARPS
jgi:sugar/nucleoside kinase (ribokinase family)